MLGLSGYGSDSDSDSGETSSKIVVSNISKPVAKLVPTKIENELPNDTGLNLPTASTVRPRLLNQTESELEDFTTKRSWETKLAEKTRQKLNSKGKKKIQAFGGLSARVFEDDDDGYVAQKPTIKPVNASTNFKSALLSCLPPPKANALSKPATSTTAFLPSAIRAKVPTPVPVTKKAKIESHSLDTDVPDESGPSTDDNDLFGLGSMRKHDIIDPLKLQQTNAAPSLFLVDEEVGPARPQQAPIEPEQVPQASNNGIKQLTDDDAKRLIYKQELQQWGASNIFANDAVSGMVDVNVDRTLGPNVQENLLKHIDHRKMATVFPASTEGKIDPKAKKTPGNKLAKMKHQITHLAGLAVAREEELQEQWAKNRESKSASKRKYGF